MDDASRVPDDDLELSGPAVDPDGERIADALRHLLRRWWLVVGGAVLGAAIAALALAGGAVDPSARATLALTDAVEWPYYERARLEQATAARSMVEEYSAEHGLASATVELPADDAITLHIDVAATSPAEAADAANELAGLIAEGSGLAAGDRLDLEVARLDEEIASLDARIDEATVEQADLIELWAAARQQTYAADVSAEDRAALERLDAARLPVDVALGDLVGRRSDLIVDRELVVSRRDAALPQLYLVAPAEPTDPREVNNLTIGLLGGLVGAVLAGAIALSWLPRR